MTEKYAQAFHPLVIAEDLPALAAVDHALVAAALAVVVDDLSHGR